MDYKKKLLLLSVSFLFLLSSFLIWVYFTSIHYSDIELAEWTCTENPPLWDGTSDIKILDWNIQFLAGKNYIFFYDAIDGSGKDEAPSRTDIDTTFNSVLRIIKEENPTFFNLQEVDVDAKRTAYEDQVERLYTKLKKDYPCVSSTYYWRAGFVPHPHIMGSVGMKLATFSKYKIESSTRYALGEFPSDIITRQFHPKRALLESVIPSSAHTELHLLNTHLEAYAQGSNLMKEQINKVYTILESLTTKHKLWILTGDFNLLMPGKSYFDLSPSQRSLYQKESELKILVDHFNVLPTFNDINSSDYKKWYTHFPNDPEVKGPDRTIDYLFYIPQLIPISYRIRNEDTLEISDHLPLISHFKINNSK